MLSLEQKNVWIGILVFASVTLGVVDVADDIRHQPRPRSPKPLLSFKQKIPDSHPSLWTYTHTRILSGISRRQLWFSCNLRFPFTEINFDRFRCFMWRQV